MNCENVHDVLIDYQDGRLDDRGCRDVGEHLAACAACRAAAAEQRAVSDVLASRPEVPVTAAFASRLAARLAGEGSWFAVADWQWWSVRFAPVAAALLVAAGIVIAREARPSDDLSLSGVVETFAAGQSDSLPVTSVLWQQDPQDESVLLTVLTVPADARIARQANER